MKRILNVLQTIVSNLFIFGLMVFAGAGIAAAGAARLQWAPPSTTIYSTNNIVSCGMQKVAFNVDYTGWMCDGTVGAKPYRFEFFLYRNGVEIEHIPYKQSSFCLTNSTFNPVYADAGTYTAKVIFQKFTSLGWKTVATDYSSNNISASKTPATPAFKLNGQLATTKVFPKVTANISQPITLDAAPTTCETRYYLGVQEGFTNENRTFQYEWGRWFEGDAPNNINLQRYSTTYSNAPDYLGDPTRVGTPLFGGDLPSGGGKRIYRVYLCTTEPAWACAYSLLRVEP